MKSASTFIRATQSFHSDPIQIHREIQTKWKKYTYAFRHKVTHDYVRLKVEDFADIFWCNFATLFRVRSCLDQSLIFEKLGKTFG